MIVGFDFERSTELGCSISYTINPHIIGEPPLHNPKTFMYPNLMSPIYVYIFSLYTCKPFIRLAHITYMCNLVNAPFGVIPTFQGFHIHSAHKA